MSLSFVFYAMEEIENMSDSLKSKDKSGLKLPVSVAQRLELLSHRRLGKGSCFLGAKVDTQEETSLELSLKDPAQED